MLNSTTHVLIILNNEDLNSRIGTLIFADDHYSAIRYSLLIINHRNWAANHSGGSRLARTNPSRAYSYPQIALQVRSCNI